MVLVAVTGMPGAGKTDVCSVFVDAGFFRIRFGDATDDVLKQQGLVRNEKNERRVREELRQKHGMAAYAVVNLPRIEQALAKGDVVIEGMYSWEEFKYLRLQFPSMLVVAVYAPPRLRYARLMHRKERPLTQEEVESRDYSEVEVLNKGGSIAMADYTIHNCDSQKALKQSTQQVLEDIRSNGDGVC